VKPGDAPPPEAEADASDAPPPPPLTPLGWVRQNGVLLAILTAFVFWIVYSFGLTGLFNAFLVAVGVGFVIFIHELGHFLAAKWCDVHVITFSIGFGPAIPGCTFQRGETTYKLAILPLGGYVHMVGEGNEADEGEDYPRSFKNKTVGQRMLIISAGVIMNVILGAICFVVVYNHGKERPTAAVWKVSPGSPAWIANVPVNSTIVKVGGVENPSFEDLKYVVALSGHDEEVEFVFRLRNGETVTKRLVPRRDANERAPIVGVSNPPRLKLPKESGLLDRAVLIGSPAAAARAVGLAPGDVVVAATDPDEPAKLRPVRHDPIKKSFDVVELTRRMSRLVGKPLTLQVVRGDGKEETIEVPEKGFEFEDSIIGATVDPHNVFVVELLPPDPDNKEVVTADPQEWRRRMNRLAGKPAVIRVQRKGGARVDLLTPPAFHVDFGMKMKIGAVSAVREQSPVAAAGLKVGDVLTKVAMTRPGWWTPTVKREWTTPLDPMRLPDELAAEARKLPHGPRRVTLTVTRADEHEHKDKDLELPAIDWNNERNDSEESPQSPASPLSIPQLGVAYYVMTMVAAPPTPGGPADQAGLREGDWIEQIRFQHMVKKGAAEWGDWIELNSTRGGNDKVYDEWPFFFTALQEHESPLVEVRVRRDGKLLENPVRMTARTDESWPLADRGLILISDTRTVRGENLAQSLGLGLRDTYRQIWNIVLQLRSLLTARISPKAMGGPIMIAGTAFRIAGADFNEFIWFLGFLSINLAVLNFLPIPILDGGHMVFLIYELIRRKPPSEKVREYAAYLGLAVIGLLMLYVFSLDFDRWLFGGRIFGNR
jgi:regulator of sigma E protease